LDKLTLVQHQTRARRMTKWKSKKAARRLKVSEFITRFMEPRVRRIRLLCCFIAAEDTIETSFGHGLPEFARDRQVIAFEQQGYGHTADIADRPFSFEQSADDTGALLQYLHVDHADVLGFSDGGTITLQVAIQHPRMVRKLVIASDFFSRDGGDPAFWYGFAHAQLQDMPKELRDAYLAAAPYPENLQIFFDKLFNGCAISRTFRPIQFAAFGRQRL
jgi:pimeloyl-ACP methyl ester carboxylesterase